MQTHNPPPELAAGLTREYLVHHRLCPKQWTPSGNLVIAVARNAYLDNLAEISFTYRASIETEVVDDDELQRLIQRITTQSDRAIELARIDVDADDTATDVRGLANQQPVVRYVNMLVRDAFDAAASDIHLEATRTGLDVRFRIDGVLVEAAGPPPNLQQAIVSRIKLLAELDIAERRRPQDGRIRVRLESRELDLRVSTVPTMYGESVVLRLLDRGGRPVGLDELGMGAQMLDAITRLAQRPHGMLLVTGPTGSGKTTTLYAALQMRSAHAEKIITVEDPIEYQLQGITQVPVHRPAGVTFASALRAMLRQDPDVVMVGEMRDEETADIAVQAAMTGHLVFSTLHTNDAVGAVPRLLDLGVPDYLVAATVEGVLAQRLVRRVCASCQTQYEPPPEHVAALAGRPIGRVRLVHGAGCADCRNTGYKGRLGIFELFVMSDEIRDAVTRRASRSELRALAANAGFVPLRSDGWEKVRTGATTVEEVLRVAHD
ncbi:MAG TPA: GspE/PulE family protein [Gemmatimonadaceae bacterium]|nr:GspE/PulE family protein [Gemmatimonadaceae bacterium]